MTFTLFALILCFIITLLSFGIDIYRKHAQNKIGEAITKAVINYMADYKLIGENAESVVYIAATKLNGEDYFLATCEAVRDKIFAVKFDDDGVPVIDEYEYKEVGEES